ncbi:MAG: serine--tRNA ligase [Candidatus Shapirobacteria bacterium]|nr:serine--tRNA ligase [Candidatus Shapirobacteria bacterium]
MLDINFIRDNQELVKKAARDKQIDEGLIDRLILVDNRRRELVKTIDELRAQRNEAAKERDITQGKEIKLKLQELEPQLKKAADEYQQLMLQVPNLPSSDTPVGRTDEDNQEVEAWGKIPKFDFPVQDHIALGKKLDLIDLEKGVRTAGFRGYYLKKAAAKLHFAVLFYAWQKIIEAGFTPMVPPTILKEFALTGSGHFPFGREDVYQIANPSRLASGEEARESEYLAGTAEPSLLAYFTNTTLRKKDLPVMVAGWTPCYRSEAGSYGKDTQGIYRIHEFAKVEQVVLCQADNQVSDQWLEKMKDISAGILQDFGLPYRVVRVCTGDMGAGKRKMYDIETWMPSRGGYGETHSDSNLTDWQSRRLNIRYLNQKGEKVFVHALNNTVLASPRILIAILENNQQRDGSILIPKVLQDLVGIDKITP